MGRDSRPERVRTVVEDGGGSNTDSEGVGTEGGGKRGTGDRGEGGGALTDGRTEGPATAEKAGFKRSTDTTTSLEPRRIVNVFGPRASTSKGPS